MEKNMEIFRHDGVEFTAINAEFMNDGSLKISGHDTGPFVEKFWGDDDYEYWLFVPKESIHDFILNLLKYVFNNEKKITNFFMELIVLDYQNYKHNSERIFDL